MSDPRNRMPEEDCFERPNRKMEVVARDTPLGPEETLKDFVANVVQTMAVAPVEKTILISYTTPKDAAPKLWCHLDGLANDGDFLAAIYTALDLFARTKGYKTLDLAERLVTHIRRIK